MNQRNNNSVPCGASGQYAVEEFAVTTEDAKFFNLRAAINGDRRTIIPGKYKSLKRNGKIIMSNTPSEMNDFRYFVYRASGDILINGLGLGVVLSQLLKKTEVKNIIAIEISQDIVSLIAPAFSKDKRVSIINADALTWCPPKGMKFDFVWHDIWDDICSDNLPEMKTLHRKYGRKTKCQQSWCREKCEYAR